MSDQEKAEITRDERIERTASAVGKTIDGLVDVGRLWAAYGLNVGRTALETSAATLRTTAGILGELSDRFAEKDERDAA